MWNLNTLTICFFCYSFLGWICEEIYCGILSHRLVNRGFLYGPYLPIYGSGAMSVVLALERFVKYPVLIFLFGMILCSVIEYVSHWAMEKIFHMKLWDYSTYRFNLNGRICLKNSTMFGLLSLVCFYVVNVPLLKFVFSIDSRVAYGISSAIGFALLLDTILSVMKMNAFKKAMLEFSEVVTQMDERSAVYLQEKEERIKADIERRRENHSKALEELRNRHFALLDKVRFVLRDNPTLTFDEKQELKAALQKARVSLQDAREELIAWRRNRENGQA